MFPSEGGQHYLELEQEVGRECGPEPAVACDLCTD